MSPKFDAQDARILRERAFAYRDRSKAGPQVGEFVRYPDGAMHRISYHWGDDVQKVQTSDGGSWYLGNHGINFSGGLDPGIPTASLTLTDETQLGSVWFFHHDQWTAHNGVDAQMTFRVWETTEKRWGA